MRGLKHLEYDNKPFFEELRLLEVIEKEKMEEYQALYYLLNRTKKRTTFLVLFAKIWMRLEQIYIENTKAFYKKDFYEKKLFLKLIKYEEIYLKDDIKSELLKSYFYITTDYFFYGDDNYDCEKIKMEGKKIIADIYQQNPRDFIIYCFYMQTINLKDIKKIKKNKEFQKKIKNLFPTDNEIDVYFRELFLEYF